ncbi:hypothetical protein [Methanobrevibacter millerae]|uniref:Uncharacterized protein n=1 Tax=Methanobrevibacter millerae TaxID=230361 RepID=A0A1G5X458_9EURY|nr:hypothetical protein [Methanobrevibacter millerae]SDA65052.1 hypothetical protein SAMN02910315_01938 [Methanobrevibacter millerae]
MGLSVEELRQRSLENRSKLKNSYFHIPMGDISYDFQITGVGKQAILISKYFFYNEIIKGIKDGNSNGFEAAIQQIIVDPSGNKKVMIENPNELKLRAMSNKNGIKTYPIMVQIGNNQYSFRIGGVGGKSIKVILFINYQDIAKNSEKDNFSLEFILKELIIGNDVEYDVFDRLRDNTYFITEEEEESSAGVDLSGITKLDPDEAKEIASNLRGWSKLLFDSIDDLDSDVFTFDDLLEVDRLKAYRVEGKSLEPLVNKNLPTLIDLGLVSEVADKQYSKNW